MARQAVTTDEQDAWAHYAQGQVFLHRRRLDEAERATLRALELNPFSGSAQELLASIIYWHEWDARDAEPIYRRAVELEPRNFSVHTGYAYYLASRGRHEEAIRAVERAIEVDPRNKNAYDNAAWRYYDARDDERAIEMVNAALAIDPEFRDPKNILGWVYAHNGQYDEAVRMFRSLGNNVGAGYALARAGRTAEARAIIEAFENEGEQAYISAMWVARLYAGVGDADATFQWLEKAFSQRDRALLFLNVDRVWDDIRGDPRFHDLRKRVGLD